jgi:hypothetical protein
LHLSFNLSDVLNEPRVGHDVASGLVVKKVPRIGDAAIRLREDRAFVGHWHW